MPRAAASSRPSARRAPQGRTACARRSSATAGGCSRTARRRSRRSRATGSTATPSSRRSVPCATAGGIPTWLGAHAVPPEFEGDADAYLDFALAEVLPEAAQVAEAADVFLERGRSTPRRRAAISRRAAAAGLALRLHGDQFTESGAIPLAVELGARSVDHLEATGADGVGALAASDVVGVLLPASALFLGRPMPPARALVDAGAAIALATDFDPGSAFCESLPLCCSLAATQLKLAPAEALAACTVNAAHVLGRADRLGRLAPGYRADVVLLDAPDWRYLAYHLGGDLVTQVDRRRRG